VSLAAALSIPAALPERELVVFLVFSTVVFTVVGQGLTLPLVIRRLGVQDDGADDLEEESRARLAAAEAALARLDELEGESWVREDTLERQRRFYGFRRRRVLAYRGEADGDGAELERRSLDFQRLTRELLRAQEAALVALRDERVISDEVLRRVQRELDLEDDRLDLDRDSERRQALLGADGGRA
jgi:NhaP-type Na+/H+ or K+/H+ antiporter